MTAVSQTQARRCAVPVVISCYVNFISPSHSSVTRHTYSKTLTFKTGAPRSCREPPIHNYPCDRCFPGGMKSSRADEQTGPLPSSLLPSPWSHTFSSGWNRIRQPFAVAYGEHTVGSSRPPPIPSPLLQALYPLLSQHFLRHLRSRPGNPHPEPGAQGSASGPPG